MSDRPALIVALHHAGGSAATFHPLRRLLGDDIRFVAVNLPGREARMREPRHSDAQECIEQLDHELAELLSEPHVLLGHSMGALLAYALAQHRVASGARPPTALIVAAYRAPNLAPTTSPLMAQLSHHVDDHALAQALVRYGGLPAEVLDRPDWIQLLMPVVRDDLRVCATYHHRDLPPLPTHLTILGGDNDPLVPHEELVPWRRHAERSTGPHHFAGGHFFMRSPSPMLIDTIRSAVFASPSIQTI